jgi:hypothetical protein
MDRQPNDCLGRQLCQRDHSRLKHRREILRSIQRDADADSNRDSYCHSDAHSYTYFDTETYTDAETGANA